MAWALLWLALSVVAGVVASAKGRSGIGYFFIALALSPLVGVILAAAMPAIRAPDNSAGAAAADAEPSELTHTRCPECAELVLRRARRCKHCGAALPAAAGAAGIGDAAQVIRTTLAGVAERNADGSERQRHIKTLCQPHQLVRLAREPTGASGRDAIAVYAVQTSGLRRREVQIGYLRPELAAELAPAIDQGREVSGRIGSIAHTGPGTTAPAVTLLLQIAARQQPPAVAVKGA